MEWVHLGHAGWLVRVGGLRLLIDPALLPTYHDGVFRVVPERRVDLERLRPDLILVSHRHPDHFDVPTLAVLARLHPEAVVLSPDPFVVEVARALGWSRAGVLAPGARLDLSGATLVTTPSRAPVREWGLVIDDGRSLVWNQVDTVLGSAAQAARVWDGACDQIGRPPGTRMALGIVQWSPLLQVAVATEGQATFPRRAWQRALERALLLPAELIVPGAAGTAYAGEGAWQNHLTFPASELRFVRALGRAGVRAEPPWPGRRYVPDGLEVQVDQDPEGLVEVLDTHDPRAFRPLQVPPVQARVGGYPATTVEARVGAWASEVLGPALERASVRWGSAVPLILVLEVITADGTAAWTFEVGAGRVRRGSDEEYDQLVVVEGSGLVDVIDGRSPWGRVLLGGSLRVVSRLPEALARRMPTVFLYTALPYETAFERWVWSVVREAKEG
jgi:UDP-MurNAc hydroxylase